MAEWQYALEQKWATLHFSDVKVETKDGQHVFEALVYLNDLDPNAVRVELYADGVGGGHSFRQEMSSDASRKPAGAPGSTVYSGAVPASRPAADYTARVILYFEGVSIPLEDARILWQTR